MGARRTRSAALLAGVTAVLVFAAASAASGPGPRVQALRAQQNAIASRLRGATLDLYALDARLGSARAKLARLQNEAAQLRLQQRQLAMQISATNRTLTISQKHLGANLRLMYEQGDTDPLAVILGAQSLTEAVSTIDGLKQVTDQSSRFVRASLLAQRRLQVLRASLAADRARIASAVTAAARSTRSLAAAQADRLSFISGLRAKQQLAASQVQQLEAAVHRAEVKSQMLTAAAAASGPVPVATGDPGPAPAPAPAPASGGRTLVVSATGYSLPGHTATGLPVAFGVVAVDPTVIPLGTRLTIPGYGEGVAADVGSGIRGAMIDLWFPSVAQAYAWGRRTVTITLH